MNVGAARGARRNPRQPGGVAEGDLRAQVRELEGELAVGDRDARGRGIRPHDARAVEAVAACRRLGAQGAQEVADRVGGLRRGAEALELRVTGVAARPTGQHLLREQPLAPAGDERGAVEDRRMQRPESHRPPKPPPPPPPPEDPPPLDPPDDDQLLEDELDEPLDPPRETGVAARCPIEDEASDSESSRDRVEQRQPAGLDLRLRGVQHLHPVLLEAVEHGVGKQPLVEVHDIGARRVRRIAVGPVAARDEIGRLRRLCGAQALLLGEPEVVADAVEVGAVDAAGQGQRGLGQPDQRAGRRTRRSR